MSTGLVLAAYGRQFLVQVAPDNRELLAVSKGRKSDIVVGDRVNISLPSADQALIESVEPRRNELSRSTARRRKTLAANIDLIGLVVSPEPRYSEAIALRVGIAAHAAGIELLVIANKQDSPAFAQIEPRLQCFEKIDIPVIRISAKGDPEHTRQQLVGHLADRTTLLMGESGMGKSTLLNSLVPDAGHRTAEISQALGTGRHTTTFSRIFTLDPAVAKNAQLIDTPGFQQFGIAHLSTSERQHAMPEFRPLLGQCRFNNCEHTNEPDCAIQTALQNGEIDPVRYKIFSELGAE